MKIGGSKNSRAKIRQYFGISRLLNVKVFNCQEHAIPAAGALSSFFQNFPTK